MGLTSQVCGRNVLREKFNIDKTFNEKMIALAGNPNTGKSTIFNALTGLNQHTGNWPGKTVLQAQGYFTYKGERYILVDLPGTYSLLAKSEEEEVARNFLCFAKPHVTIVVTDATCLERNLNLVLQIIEITPKVIVCVNFMDEAKRKKISVDINLLSSELKVPVVPTAARRGEGLQLLLDAVHGISTGAILPKPRLIRYPLNVEKIVRKLEPLLKDLLRGQLNARWVALRLLDGDQSLLESIEQNIYPGITRDLEVKLRDEFELSPI